MCWRGVEAIRTAVVGAFFLLSVSASGQLNSPYSRFGIGDLLDRSYTQSRGMGGISAGLFEPTSVNILNPASYAFLTRSILDMGVYGEVLRISDGEEAVNSGNASLSHLAFGFPVWRDHMGLSLGVTPYSRVHYHIEQALPPTDTVIGSPAYDYRGGGTLYQVHMGLGYRLRSFALGANLSYFFGTLNDTRIVSFPELTGGYATRSVEAHRLSDIILDVGAGYHADLPDDLDFHVGVAGRWKTTVNGTEDVEWTSIVLVGDNPTFKDSVIRIDGGEADVVLPPELRAGFTLRQRDRFGDRPSWLVGADVALLRWSAFRGFAEDEPFGDAWTVHAGAELTPRESPERSGRPLNYRLGMRYGRSVLDFDGERPTEFGITFGLGIPVTMKGFPTQRSSRVDFSFEIGQRSSETLFDDTFYRGTIGFRLTDANWFLRSRVD